MSLAFFGGAPGPFEVLIILFVILLLFGAKKLPELSRSLGRSLGEFRKGRDEGMTEEKAAPSAVVSDAADDKPDPPVSA